MAVHQCARYSSNPKALHELAVKRIVHYLFATRDKGLRLKPSKDLSLNMYLDADFAGMWHKEYAELRNSLLSRTGYVITFCGCPVTWSSKLQTEIALSTTESEYIALSTVTRELLLLCVPCQVNYKLAAHNLLLLVPFRNNKNFISLLFTTSHRVNETYNLMTYSSRGN